LDEESSAPDLPKVLRVNGHPLYVESELHGKRAKSHDFAELRTNGHGPEILALLRLEVGDDVAGVSDTPTIAEEAAD
jgi:hypothetical protein